MPQSLPLGSSQIFRELFLTPKQKLKLQRQKYASQGEDLPMMSLIYIFKAVGNPTSIVLNVFECHLGHKKTLITIFITKG